MRPPTRTSDKLVVISAVALLFQQKVNDDYLAGFWRQDIIPEVMWHTNIIMMPTENHDDEYIAPSWSWASVASSIGFLDMDDFKACSQILDVQITPSTMNRLGDVANGYIRLYGSVT